MAQNSAKSVRGKIRPLRTLVLWPLYLVINELQFCNRILKENILLAGLWFGKCKPKTNLFLQPFYTSFNELLNERYHLNIPGNAEPILVKGKILCLTCDLPARAQIMGMKVYNGYYACSSCKSAGERVPIAEGQQTTVHVHRYDPQIVQLRSNEEVPRFCELAEQQNNGSYRGFMFLSLLYLMMSNMILGTGIYVMHSIFIGSFKTVANFWFHKSMKRIPFSCYQYLNIIGERLKQIKFPNFVQRGPRSIVMELKHWKASEFKSFFFFYSIPVLHGILEAPYLHPHMKLVSAVYVLSQKSIFPEQIRAAEGLLHDYVREFQDLYGVRYMSMNVHMLLHLPRVVSLLGPLCFYSCSFLEDLNGGLAKVVHGTRHAGIQICSSATLYMSLSTMISELPELSLARSFCQKNNIISCRVKIAEVINLKMQVVGDYDFPRNLTNYN